MNITKLSFELAEHLGKQLDYDADKKDILRYGFEVIIGETLKIITLFAIAYLLGIASYVIVIFLTIGSYRLFSGGYHSATYGRCFILSLGLFLGIGKLVQFILTNITVNPPTLFTLSIITFVFSLLTAVKWAPTEAINKPLSQPKREKQKRLSIMWVITWFIVVMAILGIFSPEKYSLIIIGTIIGHFLQAASITPLGIKSLKTMDILADKVIK